VGRYALSIRKRNLYFYIYIPDLSLYPVALQNARLVCPFSRRYMRVGRIPGLQGERMSDVESHVWDELKRVRIGVDRWVSEIGSCGELE
jgi:hypothetical protein